jgi:two-component system nitrate/nitrite response regulator NarL
VAAAPLRDRTTSVAIRCARRLCRDALAARIAGEPGFVVTGHVADDADLLDLCQLSEPDIVLFDACASGVSSARSTLTTLRTRFEGVRVVLIYEQITPAEVASWPVGVDTLLPCSHGLEGVLVVLRRFARDRASHRGSRPPGGDLTDRERHILTLVAAGHPVSSVAAILGVSTRTVDNCKRRAYHKLDVATQGQAIARAAALGLLDAVPPSRTPSSKPGTMLVVLRGPDTPAREQAIGALLAGGIEFVVEAPNRPAGAGVRWDRGPVVLVIVEPASGPHGGAADDTMPAVVIPAGPIRPEEAAGLLRRGAVGIVGPGRIDQTLVPAVTLAAAGHVTIDPTVAAPLVSAMRGAPVGGGAMPQITTREEDILRSIAMGDTVRQTARALGIAPKTVENIQARLFRKLGVRNRAGAMAVTHALGLLKPPQDDGSGR